MFHWLKNLMPRGLYGRVTLILLLPVLGLHLIVSVLFLQRHFEDVTRQMSTSVARELLYISEVAGRSRGDEMRAELALLADRLAMEITPDGAASPPPGPKRAFYDLSGAVVTESFHTLLPHLLWLNLCDGGAPCMQKSVHLAMQVDGTILEVQFDRDRVSASNPHQLLVIMTVLGGILTVISFLYLRNQLRPIAELGRTAQAYGRGQIRPYKIRGSSEVRAAAAAFLDMRSKLERQTQARQVMLSGISHDLRTPLTRLRLGLSMIDESDSEPLLRDVDDMEKLLDAFLDYARQESEDAMVEVDPARILREVVADCARGGAPIMLRLGERMEKPMRLKPMAMRRALQNLITNAARFGTQIMVSMEFTDKVVRIHVDDDGPGIPPAQRVEAMRPFNRLDPSRNQDHGTGVGLGLAIVADVARSQGGRLELDQSEMGGLRASLILPR